jgi:hypothetical protein
MRYNILLRGVAETVGMLVDEMESVAPPGAKRHDDVVGEGRVVVWI